MDRKRLEQIREEHEKWLKSKGKEEKEGKRAEFFGTKFNKENLRKFNLSEAELERVHFSEADLRRARLFKANLQGAHFFKADLRGAKLQEAILREANLEDTKLRGADLKDADLTDVTGLQGTQLGDTNVSGAKLPEDIREFKTLAHVEEMSKNARKLLVSILLGCIYAWLTIGMTTDVQLLTNSVSAPLPIIRTPIRLVGFYWAAPILLLGLYIYFSICLQRLWEGLADLPAVFPDGRPLDKTAHPWLLNGLVRSYFKHLRKKPPHLFRLQKLLSIILAWWVVPITLLLIWGRYLRRQDWAGTSLHIVLLTVSIAAGIILHRLAAATLRGNIWKPFRWKKGLKDARTYKRGMVILGIGIIFGIFCCLSLGAIYGVNPYLSSIEPAEHAGVRTWVPRAFLLIRYSPFADLREADLSTRPPDWTMLNEEELDRDKVRKKIALVKEARLPGRNLRYADASDAFLVNADLRFADLSGAFLPSADLRGADLEGAKLHRTKLHGAALQYARLYRADLQNSYLFYTDLLGADLSKADLQSADLSRANLQNANLKSANLWKAVGLTREQIKGSAITDDETVFPNDPEEKFKQWIAKYKAGR